MPAPTPTDHSAADARLHLLLRRLPLQGVPVLPADYDRLERVLRPGRGLDAAAFEDTLVALLAKDETQRHTLRREVRRLFPRVPAPGSRTGRDQAAAAGDGSTADPGPAAPAPAPAPPGSQSPSGAVREGLERAAPTVPVLLVGRPERRRPRALVLVTLLAAALALGLLPANLGQAPPPPDAPLPEPPPPDLPPPPAGALPDHPIARFDTWVPVITRTPPAGPPAWPATLLALAGLLGLGWLAERLRGRAHPPANPEVHGFRPGAESVLCWPESARRLPPPLDPAQRRTLIWGVRPYATERPSHRLDTVATVAASARQGRPQVCWEPARRLREVWLWRDTALADPAAAVLLRALERDLARAGLRVRHGAFRALPDRVWLDLDPDGQRRSGAGPRALADLTGESREALVAVFTDGRGLAAALRAGGARAARVHRVLRVLGGWPRCALIDCAGAALDLPALVRALGLPKGQAPDCIEPADLPAWLAERARAEARPRPAAVPSAEALFALACSALPGLGLPVTAAQEAMLCRRLGLASGVPVSAGDHSEARSGAAGRRFAPAGRRRLLIELAAQVWPEVRAGQAAPQGYGQDPGGGPAPAAGVGWVERSETHPDPVGPDPVGPVRAAGRTAVPIAPLKVGPRRRLDLALDFWQGSLDAVRRVRDDRGLVEAAPDPGSPAAWSEGPADHRLALERQLLELWRTPGLAAAVKALYDRWCFYGQQADRPDLDDPTRQVMERARAALTERLAELSAADLGDPNDGRIHLPWETGAIRELPGEPPGTTLSRLFRMGFAGAAPRPGRRPRPGAEVRLALGLLAGAALGALAVLAFPRPPPPGEFAEHFVQRLEDGALDAFRAQTHLVRDGTRVFAASRKVAASADLGDGGPAELVWCWSGAAPPETGPDAAGCRALWEQPDDPRRLNLAPIGDQDPERRTVLLRAGTLAEPIRACTRAPDPPWPGLSVAVIAAGPWRDPPASGADADARRLAIRLLDSGAVDLAIVGPDWAAAARQLAADWSAVPDGQWLFFIRERGLPARERPTLPMPTDRFPHQALIQADYARLVAHLRERVQGVLDVGDQRERPPLAVARITTLTGRPRLWGGPERETVHLPDGTPLDLVRVCPGTFTMGADGMLERRLPQIVAETLGRDPAALTDDTPLDAAALGGEAVRERLRGALDAGLGTAIGDDDWKAVADLRSARDRFTKWYVWGGPEDPAHPVLMIAFDIARTETTVPQGAALGSGERSGDKTGLPLADIDWDQARKVCAALPDGALPTEAQWEYAARGGSRTAWSWGDDAAAAGDYAWFAGNSGNQAHPVGVKTPNPLGLADMHGNLWEWVRDCYDENAYQVAAGRLSVMPPKDAGECRLGVLRGGSSWFVPGDLRSAFRLRYVPEDRLGRIGCRCVRSAPRSSLAP